MMNWKECGGQKSWYILEYIPIFPGIPSQNIKVIFRIVGLGAAN
jgi:hypothetical protein